MPEPPNIIGFYVQRIRQPEVKRYRRWEFVLAEDRVDLRQGRKKGTLSREVPRYAPLVLWR